LLDGQMTERSRPLHFWEFNLASLDQQELEPWIASELQQGTTPLVKLMGGKATRAFNNYRHPTITEDHYHGPRAIIDGRFKLVIHDQRSGNIKRELFDLESDPAETRNLLAKQSETAERLQIGLRKWQQSVLQSLRGADYVKLSPSN
jgi:arylsulfatase A-like enzyme